MVRPDWPATRHAGTASVQLFIWLSAIWFHLAIRFHLPHDWHQQTAECLIQHHSTSSLPLQGEICSLCRVIMTRNVMPGRHVVTKKLSYPCKVAWWCFMISCNVTFATAGCLERQWAWKQYSAAVSWSTRCSRFVPRYHRSWKPGSRSKMGAHFTLDFGVDVLFVFLVLNVTHQKTILSLNYSDTHPNQPFIPSSQALSIHQRRSEPHKNSSQSEFHSHSITRCWPRKL